MTRFFLVSFFVALCNHHSFALEEPDRRPYENKLRIITARVATGDYAALNEASELPASVAVPYLSTWTDRAGQPEGERAAAVKALTSVRGYAEYLRNHMSTISLEGVVPARDFDVLRVLRTREAAEIAASYLFDVKTVMPESGDVGRLSNVEYAVLAIDDIDLPGTPKPEPKSRYPSSDHLIALQKWSIAERLVPESWESRVGAPDWMLKEEEMERKGRGGRWDAGVKQPVSIQSPLIPTPPTTAGGSPKSLSSVHISASRSPSPPSLQQRNVRKAGVIRGGVLFAVIALSAFIIWRRLCSHWL